MLFRGINFKTKLLLTNALLILVALGAYAGFSIYSHEREKMQDLKRAERVNALHLADRLSRVLANADRMTPEQIAESPDLILAVDFACVAEKNPEVHVSRTFAPIINELGKDAMSWSKRQDLLNVCENEVVNPAGPPTKMKLLESLLPFPIPYILVLYSRPGSSRLAMLSMGAFQTSIYSTSVIVVGDQMTWAEDGLPFAQKALQDVGATQKQMMGILADRELSEAPLPSITKIGDNGLMTYASLHPNWQWIRLSFLPATLSAVEKSKSQATYLAFGMIALALLLGRILARNFVRSIEEFIVAADEVGKGNFNLKLDESGTDEFSRVRRAMNHLSATILKMTEELVHKAKLSFELSTAGEVQKLLLPAREVRAANHLIYGTVTPAEYCGGDWWGFYTIKKPDGGELMMLLMIDISGHGTGSALISATIRGFVAAISEQATRDPVLTSDPAHVIGELDRMLAKTTGGDFVATGIAALFDCETNKVTLSNGGHPRPFLLGNKSSPGDPLLLSEPAPLLGASSNEERKSLIYDWVPGSRLVIYSDGLIAPPLDETAPTFKSKDLKKVLKAGSSLGGSALSKKILTEHPSGKLKAGLSDDLTLLVIERGSS